MLNQLDNLIRGIFIQGITDLTTEAQVRFQPPDEGWRNTYMPNLGAVALNVYLVELRENRKLRSNERVRTVENGIVNDDPAPARLDCHYLVSAWSPATATAAIEPSLDEHALLYQATAAVMHNAPFNPSRVYPAGSTPLNAWPAPFRDVDLPVVVAPVEGFNKLAEFWGSMGQGNRWKPVLYLIVTVPVALLREVAGPIVTTRITEYRIKDHPDTAETWIQIGGHVLDTANLLPNGSPSPVAEAWVELENQAGERLQTTQTNQAGRFTFGELRPGRYRLQTRGTGQGVITREVDVPSPSGEYDLQF